MTAKDLGWMAKVGCKVAVEIAGKSKVQNNAYSMHSRTGKYGKHQAHGGFWLAMGLV
jgi:hypothetical protein